MNEHNRKPWRIAAGRVGCALAAFLCWLANTSGWGQVPQVRHGSPVPFEVKTLYDAGLVYLQTQQGTNGSWKSDQYGVGPGIDGLCCLAFLSCGEDPNFGKYADTLRKGLRAIVRKQHADSGLLASSRGSHGSMYHHGFGTLALAEAYGVVDEQMLWADDNQGRRELGKALELAVRCILKSQDQNPHHAWRYTPTSKDADVSVSGANVIALLAARNAGIAIPEKNMQQAIEVLKAETDSRGAVAYQIGTGTVQASNSLARSSIVCLSLAIAKEKESDAFQHTLKFIRSRAELTISNNWPHYTRYYMSQALFQADFEAWRAWNKINTRRLKQMQGEDGNIGGHVYPTAMSLLSMALNYRFLPIYER